MDKKLTQSVEQGERSREWEKKRKEGDPGMSYYEAAGKKTRQYDETPIRSVHSEARGSASSSSGWNPQPTSQQWEWQKWKGQWWWRRAGTNDRWQQ